MRRKDREVTDFDKIIEIIEECDIIRIGLGDGEFPYIVPVNFGYEILDGQVCFYIHGAAAGKKYELMRKLKKCSFEMDCGHRLECIYESMDATMRYKCVMGNAYIEFLDDDEKERAMDIMMSRNAETRGFEYPHSRLKGTLIARLKVISLTAKVNQ